MTQQQQPPQSQKALVGTTEGAIGLVHDAPVPQATGDSIVVKVAAVAVNPVDSKLVGDYVTPGAAAGFDYAGVVVALGPEATQFGWKVGDRVCSAVSGMNANTPEIGAFAEYTSSPEWFLWRLPDAWTFEQGASMGISWLTAGMALFHTLNLPGRPFAPSPKPIQVFVFGGSSSTGVCVIQLLKLAGFEVITTCSPHNFDYVRSFGPDHVLDYKADDVVAQIKALTKNGLRWVVDCISTTSSMQFCYQVVGRAGGRFVTLEPFSEAVAQTRKIIKADFVISPNLLGEVTWPEPHYKPENKEVIEFGRELVAIVNQLLEKELIRPHNLLVRNDGLEGISQGLKDIREGKMSGKKLIYVL
ncbi:hypothetical protein GGTG_07562 [Gaeumannomyces tritici R3-111a-1]|uniref:Enoyl reductase (ER) domain-containing protein n=1 Tax=Gaeumannomyces tritici (strain R3-111a-1) TaxID=644352 RepID=J3P214_GAET3|nr:hypothetical protein GGTG_07562 [Gaeumannomyces tritici R3-111a-1]EJT73706.1 hypothetical protein GGTG_07562 [Gaeumannomyces tritici R3-111a-1]